MFQNGSRTSKTKVTAVLFSLTLKNFTCQQPRIFYIKHSNLQNNIQTSTRTTYALQTIAASRYYFLITKLGKRIDRQLLWRHNGKFWYSRNMCTSRTLRPVKLEKILPNSSLGLYQDDRLALLRNLNGQQTEKVRTNIIRVIQSYCF